MIAVERCVLVLLAAGRSSRFGDRNKLEQDFLGKPVGLHVVTALEDMPFMERVAVIDDCSLDFASRGYTILRNEDAASGMSGSLRMGVAIAKARGAEAAVIALADMPRVTATHIRRLLDAAESTDAVVVSSDGAQPMPPGVFGRDRFDSLMTLQGDKGARDLVKSGQHVVTTPTELIDIDTPEDLEKLRQLIHALEWIVTHPAA